MRKNKKGQSVIEYALLVTAFIIIFVLMFAPGGLYRDAFIYTLNAGINRIESGITNLTFNTDRP